ncbi:unnamed protein product [Allacma fusca]|uniref:MADF domain-containing protein n=1 Tax=Allacma fusca TaxID=39272 RepID=A0A8J2JQS6_9HEXA|nr:unnamed protein product [Allacma fusca]
MIELVKLKSPIYKKSDPQHGNSIVIGNCWDWIYDQIQPTKFAKDASACRTQWKRIRDQWLAYKRKLTSTSGQASGRIPFFRHENSMRFCEDPSETDCLNGTICNDVNDNLNEIKDDHKTIPTVTITSVQPPTVPSSQGQYLYKNAKRPKIDPFGEELLKVVKGREMSHIQHLCHSVAIKLEKIAARDPKAAAQLQQKIQTLVSEKEIELL